MRWLVCSVPPILIFGFAAACGGSTTTQSSDAGTSNDGGSSRDGQSTAKDAGTDIDSGGVVKTGGNTPGISLDPDIAEWSTESTNVVFTFSLIVADPSLKLASVDGANIWFDGDTPHAFGFGHDTDLGTPNASYDWQGSVTNAPGAHVTLSVNTASKGAIAGADARPYSPYAAGTLHVLLYGTLSTGSEWQASTTFTSP